MTSVHAVDHANDQHQTTTMAEVEMTTTPDVTKSTPQRMSKGRPANRTRVTRGVATEEAAVDEDHHSTTMTMTTTATCLEETDLDHAICEPGDSVTSCADKERRKVESSMFKLPTLPRSADELGDFQFVVENTFMLVSGRRNRRLKWIIATTLAKHPDKLESW
jgi:hypothetical protein